MKSEEIYASNEVYVTPSPYIDHEYSHCQAQLRRPEENQLVNKYNDNYFSERLTELMSLYPLVKAFVDTIVNDMNVDYETDGFDDGFSSSEQDMYSEDYDNDESQQIKDSNSHEQCDCDVIPPRRSYRRQSLQASDFSVRQRRPRIASRGIRRRRGGGARAMKLSASLNSNPTRRSKRVIKAPRRPYDDFENVDYYDYELDNDEYDRIVEEEEKGEEDEGDPRPSDVESENENQTNPTENHKYRKDFFLSKTLKRPYQAMIDSHSNSDNCDRYLSPSIDADYESSEADDNADDSYHHRYSDSAIQLSQIKSRKSSSTTYEINNVWTTVMKCSVNRRKIHESIATEDCHSTYLEHNRTKEKDLDNSIVNYEEEVVEEPLEQQQRRLVVFFHFIYSTEFLGRISSFAMRKGTMYGFF
ncbi:unnamed protein product [Trichobilharzia regenti]|nr:unnamed protein product [Trichobilharzia regenti]